jgi:hypothetical protein
MRIGRETATELKVLRLLVVTGRIVGQPESDRLPLGQSRGP